jgi:hypothetical protein
MGGRGSGRHWRYGTKETTDNRHALDVRKLQRSGVLRPGYSCQWSWSVNKKEVACINLRSTSESVIFLYRCRTGGGDWQDMQYPVPVEWTTCHFGGQRAWFRCPVVGCVRRVAILYSGVVFACRHCYHLVYGSQREDLPDRVARRADKIRKKLGWEPGILNHNGWKPKGMHWQTFEKLRTQHDAIVNVALQGIARKLRLFER